MSDRKDIFISGLYDLTSYDNLDTHLSGRVNINYFLRAIKKHTWFTLVPCVLSRTRYRSTYIPCNEIPNFNSQWSSKIHRNGDYLINTWLRVTIPKVVPNTISGTYGVNTRLRWCKNFMHNLIKEVSLTFNGLVESRFDNWCFDFWTAYAVPQDKQKGYSKMIGNIMALTNPLAQSPPSMILPECTLNLPLILPHGRDSGIALPTAALPYTEITINFSFNDWTNLLIADDIVNGVSSPAVLADISGGVAPSLVDVECWANYAVVSSNERKRTSVTPRRIVIERFETVPVQNYDPNNPSEIILNFSNSVKAIFFGIQNSTTERSNYTTASPVATEKGIYYTNNAVDPIKSVSLKYGSLYRLQNIPADYHSLIAPYYHAETIPEEIGYHLYSYSLYFPDVDPKGSTNYNQLKSASLIFNPSEEAFIGSAGTGSIRSGQDKVQSYQSVVVAVSNFVIAISGGALGILNV